jgi:hypothetical protein
MGVAVMDWPSNIKIISSFGPWSARISLLGDQIKPNGTFNYCCCGFTNISNGHKNGYRVGFWRGRERKVSFPHNQLWPVGRNKFVSGRIGGFLGGIGGNSSRTCEFYRKTDQSNREYGYNGRRDSGNFIPICVDEPAGLTGDEADEHGIARRLTGRALLPVTLLARDRHIPPRLHISDGIQMGLISNWFLQSSEGKCSSADRYH